MKHFTLRLLLVILFACIAPLTYCQTLVNLAWVDTTPEATYTLPYQSSVKLGDTAIIVLYVVYSGSGTNTNYITVLAKRYNTSTGAVEWQDSSSYGYGTLNLAFFETFPACRVVGNNAYLAIGADMQEITDTSFVYFDNTIAVEKFNVNTGAANWENIYENIYSGHGPDTNYITSTAITLDAQQNVYVTGIKQTGPASSAILVLKVDSNGNQVWFNTDSTGVFSGGAAIAINPGDTTLTVTGFSGTAWNSWDFVTATVTTDSGNMTKASFSAYGPAFQTPAGLGEDYSGRAYIAGTVGAGSGTAIELIGYDTALNQRFAKIWANADSMHLDSAARLQQDVNANLLITGYTTASNGAKQLLVLKYNTNDSLLWYRAINAPNPAYDCTGNDVAADDSLNVYVTGKVWNGTDWDFITMAFDKNGNTIWAKQYDGGGTNDVANDIVVDNNADVFVSGISSIDTGATYTTLEYTQTTAYIPTDSINANGPFAFYENHGQLYSPDTMRSADSIFYYTTAGNPQLFISNSRISYVIGYTDSTDTYDSVQRFDMQLINIDRYLPAPNIYPDAPVNAYLNYYLGYMTKPVLRVQGYNHIVEKNVYTGIDWQIASTTQGVKNYFVVYAGNDPAQIVMQFSGQDSISIRGNSMQIFNHAGNVQFDTLLAYTVDSIGDTVHITVSYDSLGENSYAFTLGSYNTGRNLIIESNLKSLQTTRSSSNMTWSTYYGGSSTDNANAVKTDGNNNIILTGSTQSTTNFPPNGEPSVTSTGGLTFVVKFDDNGIWQWTSYLGDINSSEGDRIAINSSNEIFVVGQTTNPYPPEGPTLSSPVYQTPSELLTGTSSRSYIARFNNTSGALTWLAYLSATQNDIAFDANDNLYMVGGAVSNTYITAVCSPTATITPYCFTGIDAVYGSSTITKFDPNLEIIWFTRCGHTSLQRIAMDANNIYMVGLTEDADGSPIVMMTSGQQSYGGGSGDGLFLEFDHNDNWLFGTYIGGNGLDEITGVTTGLNMVYMCAFTQSTNFPTTKPLGSSPLYYQSTAYSNVSSFDADGIFISWDPSTNAPRYITYCGGTGDDEPSDLVADGSTVYMTGSTTSTDLNNVTPTSYFQQTSYAGETDAFIFQFVDIDLDWSTYLGGNNFDEASGITLNTNHTLYVVGETSSAQNTAVVADGYPIFDPTSPAGVYFQPDLNLQVSNPGNFPAPDAFISAFDISSSPTAIKQISSNSDALIIYPNPTSNAIQILQSGFIGQNYQTRIFNTLGQVVYTTNSAQPVIDVSGFAQGVYLLQLGDDSSNKTAKFVKQ